MAWIARRSILCPRPVPALDGTLLTEAAAPSGPRHFVRVLTWLEGTPLGDLKQRDQRLLQNLGGRVAELDRALEGFDHPAIHRDFYWDLAKAPAVVPELAPLVEDSGLRARVTRLARGVVARDGACLSRLRRASAHNDPNDHNVLVHANLVNAVIDFGDIVHT